MSAHRSSPLARVPSSTKVERVAEGLRQSGSGTAGTDGAQIEGGRRPRGRRTRIAIEGPERPQERERLAGSADGAREARARRSADAQKGLPRGPQALPRERGRGAPARTAGGSDGAGRQRARGGRHHDLRPRRPRRHLAADLLRALREQGGLPAGDLRHGRRDRGPAAARTRRAPATSGWSSWRRSSARCSTRSPSAPTLRA